MSGLLVHFLFSPGLLLTLSVSTPVSFVDWQLVCVRTLTHTQTMWLISISICLSRQMVILNRHIIVQLFKCKIRLVVFPLLRSLSFFFFFLQYLPAYCPLHNLWKRHRLQNLCIIAECLCLTTVFMYNCRELLFLALVYMTWQACSFTKHALFNHVCIFCFLCGRWPLASLVMLWPLPVLVPV